MMRTVGDRVTLRVGPAATLPGPSRTITVEPIEHPQPVREPERPSEAPAEPPVREPSREEPVPAR